MKTQKVFDFKIKSFKKKYSVLSGKLAAGTKETAGNGWENGIGMTEGTEYME